MTASTVPTTPPTDATPFTVAVIEEDPRRRTQIAVQLGDVRAAAFPTLDAVDNRLNGHGAVLILGPGFSRPGDMAQVGRFLKNRQHVSAVLVADELTTATLQQAMRAGVVDVVASAAGSDDLLDALDRAAERVAVGVARPVPTSAEPARPPRGRVTTVFSTKGGVGTSVLATNLAAALARTAPGPVALVDADLQFGDVAVMLQLAPRHTVVEAATHPGRLDDELLRSLVVTHEPSGLLVLPAPTDPALSDGVTGGDIGRVLEGLASFCSHVVVDTAAAFDDIALGAFEESDDILLLAALDIPTVKNLKIGLQTMRRLSVATDKVRLAVNRSNSKVRLDVAEVERTLQAKAELLMPSDVAVPRSVNKGVPVVLDAPRAGVSRSIDRFAATLTAPAEAR